MLLVFGLVGDCLLLYCLQIVYWLGFALVCWFDLVVVANWYCILVVSGVLLWVCLVSSAVCELVFDACACYFGLGYMFDGCFCFGFGRLLLTVEWICWFDCFMVNNVVIWKFWYGVLWCLDCCGVCFGVGCCALFVLLGVTVRFYGDFGLGCLVVALVLCVMFDDLRLLGCLRVYLLCCFSWF